MTQVKDLNRKRVCDISDDGKVPTSAVETA